MLAAPAAARPRVGCTSAQATTAAAGRPTAALAWRARVVRPVPVYARLPGNGRRPARAVRPRDASWLMVTRAAEDARGRCWVRVRLPWRPSSASGWVNAKRVRLQPTRWRIVVSRTHRTLTLLRRGTPVLRSRVVIGAPSTPTPGGHFAVLWVQPGSARSFLGQWVIGLTAHSRVLDTFDGGDGRIALHGRGAQSLLDPLGSARSHGCVRLPNRVIDRLVRRVGPDALPGVRVAIR
ncbi:L,D-transpeptidase [Baekduia sp. Peel2402]|uniref:L,D-transpeptidase n=1 Tax=Baekduia sp. Peel2402 TaxID=3458296 RepID=UPI00403E6E87